MPFGMVNANEVELSKSEKFDLNNEDFHRSLDIISNNYELFSQDIDLDIIESYKIEDKNLALLKFYAEQYENEIGLEKNFNVQRAMPTNTDKIAGDGTVQPLWGFLVRTIVKSAIKKKMGKKIEKEIGDQVDKKVVSKAQDAAERAADKYGYSKSKGPESSGAPNGINQGEHIIELIDSNGSPFFRLHVYKNPAGNHTRWHWHERDDWNDHRGNIDIYHNTLPKWGAE